MVWERSHTMVAAGLSAEQIWKLFERVDLWSEWDESVEESALEGEFAAGNFFRFKPKGGPRMRIELIRVEAQRRFTDKTRFFLATMTGDHVFEPCAEGLRMTTTMRVTGPLAWLWVKIVAQGIVDSLPNDMRIQAEMARIRE